MALSPGGTKVRSVQGKKRPRSRANSRRQLTDNLPLIAAVVAALLLAGFVVVKYVIVGPNPAEGPKAVCAVLMDRTQSSRTQGITDRYEAVAKGAIETCADHKAVTYFYYFGGAGDKLKEPAKNGFELYRPKGFRDKLRDEELAEQKSGAQEALAQVVAASSRESAAGGPEASPQWVQLGGGRKSPGGSDLISPLDEISNQVNQTTKDRDVDEVYLLVLTDGLQNDKEFGFRKWINKPSSSPRPLLDAISRVGMLPDLDGAQVSFAGVGAGGSKDLEPWFAAGMENFWRKFVEAAGGEVCFYGLDGESLPTKC